MQEFGADLIFAPSVEEMYPDNSHLTVIIPPEFLTDKLCGKTRTGHFDGVAIVVVKLLNIIQPDFAFFGQKDAQQLIIIRKVCQDLNLPAKIVGCPIIRDDDGLACSSRNAYLSAESRQKALSLFKALKKVEELYNSGVKLRKSVLNEAKKLLNENIALEYFEVFDAVTLEPLDSLKPNSLVAIAAKVDGVRLIDNIIIL